MKSQPSNMTRSPDGSRNSRPGDLAKTTRDAYRTLSLSSVGLEMGIAVIIGVLLGRWLDGKVGTSPWMLLLFTGLGMAAGMKGVFRAVREADKIAAENEAEAKS
jgi:ATP synthase protein I